jgi:nicotinamide riboside transporter PnuC
VFTHMVHIITWFYWCCWGQREVQCNSKRVKHGTTKRRHC